MIKALAARLQQGRRTVTFPKELPYISDRLKGLPSMDRQRCDSACQTCLAVCPTQALSKKKGHLTLDMGRCLFCGKCQQVCPNNAITFSNDYRLAARKRSELEVAQEQRLAAALDTKMKKLFGRSLKLRQVSSGGCNACEADCNVLTTLVFDLGRFGIQFVASPRHADGVLVTGPVTKNMKLALEKTYAAIAEPKLCIATGACAISGGIYRDCPESLNGADSIIPIDLYIPGCPPHPLTILDGLLRLLGQIE